VKRNAQKLPPVDQWRIIGRAHLLAYLRNRTTLYRGGGAEIAEGEIGDCAEMDKHVIGAGDRPFPARKPGELCEKRVYGFHPHREVAADAHDQPRRKSIHLSASLRAYGHAKHLAPRDLRTRLAVAFVLDRLVRLNEARAELHFILLEGARRTARMPGYQLESMTRDLHDTLSEAVEHLTRIADAKTDRQLLALIKRRLVEGQPPRMVTPVLVPMTSNVAFEDLIDRESNIAFDFAGQGRAERMGWLSKNAAWLVWDPKRKGKIESGFQLFGSATWIMFWENGYRALGTLDDNADGRIAGVELEGLALWHDENANGISDAGEVQPVTDQGIVALSYAHHRASTTLWISRAGVTFRDGRSRPTYDWLMRSRDVLARN
jgi:hypothetical protein